VVVVTAAAGALGLATVDLAANVFGAKVRFLVEIIEIIEMINTNLTASSYDKS